MGIFFVGKVISQWKVIFATFSLLFTSSQYLGQLHLALGEVYKQQMTFAKHEPLGPNKV